MKYTINPKAKSDKTKPAEGKIQNLYEVDFKEWSESEEELKPNKVSINSDLANGIISNIVTENNWLIKCLLMNTSQKCRQTTKSLLFSLQSSSEKFYEPILKMLQLNLKYAIDKEESSGEFFSLL